MTVEQIMWLFPVVFMAHELEEIILLPGWLARNRNRLARRLPPIARPLLGHLERLTPSAFALVVAEQLAIVAAVTVLGAAAQLHHLFAGFVVAFLLHLIVHLAQVAWWRAYIPTVAASVIAVPWCAWVLGAMAADGSLGLSPTLTWSVAATGIAMSNLVLMHRVAARFASWERERQ